MLWLFKQEENSGKNEITYQFWQSDNHAELCFSLPFAWQKLTYIHNNPVRAGTVSKAEEYKRSSAADYHFGKQRSKIKITPLDAMVKTVK